MKRKQNLLITLLLIALALVSLLSFGKEADGPPSPGVSPAVSAAVPEGSGPAVPDENGVYTKKDDVALYVYTYGKLPDNFITKSEARALGWEGGDLRPYARDKSIGGDRFMNFERKLPNKKGRIYYEADIDTLGKSSRGAKRLVFSNDGLIYYTDNHYESFTLLYGGN